MPRTVVLVDPDLDALGSLASQLRARGLTVGVADSWQAALVRITAMNPDAVIVARELERQPPTEVPCFEVGARMDSPNFIAADPDGIARRLLAMPLRRAPVAVERGDFRGDLGQVGIVDLLQLLGMNRRTGQLSVTTEGGGGEVRLVDGEVVDAAYRRLEGEKALFRLLGAEGGTFAFSTTAPTSLRRIDQSLNSLVMEGMRQGDDLRRRRRDVCGDGDALLATRDAEDDAPETQARILQATHAPRSLDEILDDVPAPDLEIVEVLLELIASGQVRRISSGAERTPFADPEHAALLGAIVSRMASGAFGSSARVILAGTVSELAAAMHAMRRFVEATAPTEGAPAAPVPHALAMLRLGDGVELEVMGLPMLDAYAPLWPLSLAGAALVLALSSQSVLLEQACAAAGVPLRCEEGAVDAADPADLGRALREALDAVAGRK